jgi:uncharacterized protein YjiS (DUF1127 family)
MSQNGLSRRQKTFVATLLSAQTIGAACQASGVPRATVGRWQQQAAFRAAIDGMLDQALADAGRLLAQRCAGALVVLASIAGDKFAPASARVAASAKILDSALRFYEAQALAQRLELVEAAIIKRESEQK